MTNDLLISLIVSLQAMVLLLSAQVAELSTSQAQNTTGQVAQAILSAESPTTLTAPISFTAINNLHKDAVVNILCKGSGKFKGGTATGVIISPTGLMLTNAHMAQYMLLEQLTNASVSCTIRTGSPAKAQHKAQVIYMPPAWVKEHAKDIVEKTQRGTGEHDYALLQIIQDPSSDTPLPEEFTYIQPDASLVSSAANQAVLIRAYPAEFVGSHITLSSLRPVSTVTTIGSVATFSNIEDDATPTIDLISLGGTIVAQGGSSGGAVISDSAKLTGLIVTSTRKAETKDRNLKAITLSHINASIKEQTDKSLDELIALPIADLIKEYQAELLESAHYFADAYNK